MSTMDRFLSANARIVSHIEAGRRAIDLMEIILKTSKIPEVWKSHIKRKQREVAQLEASL